MRPLILLSAFFLLVGLVYFSWRHRFECASASHPVSLSDLRAGGAEGIGSGHEWLGTEESPILRLKLSGNGEKSVCRFKIPGIDRVKFLHVRLLLIGDGLVPGKEIWEDGRLMLEWHEPDSGTWKIDALASLRHSERKMDSFVAKANKDGAVPVLRLEHLGNAGAIELHQLELRELRETAWWHYGRWFLALAWLGWGYAVARSWQNVSFIRALGASAIFVTMGVIAVVPGQWKIQRPLGGEFVIKENPQGLSPRVDSSNANDSKNFATHSLPNSVLHDLQKPLGKIPVQGGILLVVKYYLPAFRPILHMLLIVAPTLAMALLAGWRPALMLSVILSAAIEIAQVAFGYGFDRTDVTDLAWDAIGIAIAMLVFKFTSVKRVR